MKNIKCVLVGNDAAGKTCLAISYTTNNFPDDYIPTVMDNYNMEMSYKRWKINLEIVDTDGSEEYDNLRPMYYKNVNVFIICFSILSRTHFDRVKSHWISEIKPYAKKAHIILVGTKSDRRGTIPESLPITEVSKEEGETMAKHIGAESYIECSALTQENLKEVFEEVCRVHLQKPGSVIGKKDPSKNPQFKK